ncbi:MAG: hypothetical protein B7Z81_00160 [Acidocella sp. 20-61-6]|nr:MAG: hypothetical protein B7Z81_00160 [Acidocella sp. 20-61-6]
MRSAKLEGIEAFTSIGVAPEKAMAAAAALNRRDALSDVARVKADLSVMKWMVGLNIAMTAAILVKLFVH